MVGNVLRLMLTRGLSIIRWNNFPRVVDIKHMDNVGATLHTVLFLASLEEQEIDILYLMKKTLFNSFSDLILSDINSGTKNYIKRMNPAMYDELYGKAFSYFSSQSMPEEIKKDFTDVLERRDRAYEDRLILAAKKYVGFTEATSNARVFYEMYDVPLTEMKSELEELCSEIPSLHTLMHTKDYEKYLAHIFRLSYSMRWNQYQRSTPISVMSHKVIVAYLAYVIGMIGNIHGEKNDIRAMLLRAIYHDVPEVITGDIINPTKNAIKGFPEALETVESAMLDDYLFSYIPKDFKTALENYILHPFEGELGKKVKYADILSALVEAKIEAPTQSIFREKYNGILQKVENIHHPGVEFIQKEIFLHFDKVSDDTIHSEKRNYLQKS